MAWAGASRSTPHPPSQCPLSCRAAAVATASPLFGSWGGLKWGHCDSRCCEPPRDCAALPAAPKAAAGALWHWRRESGSGSGVLLPLPQPARPLLLGRSDCLWVWLVLSLGFTTEQMAEPSQVAAGICPMAEGRALPCPCHSTAPGQDGGGWLCRGAQWLPLQHQSPSQLLH